MGQFWDNNNKNNNNVQYGMAVWQCGVVYTVQYNDAGNNTLYTGTPLFIICKSCTNATQRKKPLYKDVKNGTFVIFLGSCGCCNNTSFQMQQELQA